MGIMPLLNNNDVTKLKCLNTNNNGIYNGIELIINDTQSGNKNQSKIGFLNQLYSTCDIAYTIGDLEDEVGTGCGRIFPIHENYIKSTQNTSSIDAYDLRMFFGLIPICWSNGPWNGQYSTLGTSNKEETLIIENANATNNDSVFGIHGLSTNYTNGEKTYTKNSSNQYSCGNAQYSDVVNHMTNFISNNYVTYPHSTVSSGEFNVQDYIITQSNITTCDSGTISYNVTSTTNIKGIGLGIDPNFCNNFYKGCNFKPDYFKHVSQSSDVSVETTLINLGIKPKATTNIDFDTIDSEYRIGYIPTKEYTNSTSEPTQGKILTFGYVGKQKETSNGSYSDNIFGSDAKINSTGTPRYDTYSFNKLLNQYGINNNVFVTTGTTITKYNMINSSVLYYITDDYKQFAYNISSNSLNRFYYNVSYIPVLSKKISADLNGCGLAAMLRWIITTTLDNQYFMTNYTLEGGGNETIPNPTSSLQSAYYKSCSQTKNTSQKYNKFNVIWDDENKKLYLSNALFMSTNGSVTMKAGNAIVGDWVCYINGNIWVIPDSIYQKYVYGANDDTITINGVTKTKGEYEFELLGQLNAPIIYSGNE